MRRLLLAVFATCTISLFAQDAPPPGTPGGGPRPASFKYLKILKPVEVRAAMGSCVTGTGMKCADCHVQGAFDSDEKAAESNRTEDAGDGPRRERGDV